MQFLSLLLILFALNSSDLIKTLVTGGTGIVGTRLMFDLLSKQREVWALKRPDSSTLYTEKAFEFYDSNNGLNLFNNINWMVGDIRDSVAMNELLMGFSDIYHCAALVSFKLKDKEKLMQTNIQGTQNIVNAALINGIKKFCFISSVAALERNNPNELVTEKFTGAEIKRRSNYGQSKFLAELEVWRGIEEGLNSVIVNPSLILGAGRPDMSSGLLYRTVLKGLNYYGPGSNGVVDVRSISEVCIELMDRELFNERIILSAHNISHKELFTIIAESVGKKPPTRRLSPTLLKFGSVIAGLMALMGLEPFVSKESLKSAVKQIRYDNTKLKNFVDMNYPSAEDSIKYFAGYYQSLDH